MFKRPGVNQSSAVCLWSQVVVVLAVVLLGWAAFSELFSNQAVVSNKHDQMVVGGLKEPHIYSPPVSVIDQVDCAFLTRVKMSAQRELNKINSYWQVQDFPNFLRMMHIPPTSWSLQKAKFINLLLEQSQAVANSSKNDYLGRTYVAGFSGSSVTAGHDNYFNEAFPAVFERSLSSVFTAMNMKLVVRNNAIGNNPCFPYDACIATHLGDDLDILAWEQSMNCGRESRPLDTFTRTALRMKKSPTVLYVLSGGPAWKPEECINITASNKGAELQKQRLPSLPSIQQIRDTASQLDPSFKIDDKHQNILSSMEFLRDGAEHLYDATRFAAVAPMGHSTFPCQDYRCFGPYIANFTAKTPGGNGANWHPGALGHKLRGENMAYFFLAMLLDALESIESLVRLVPGTCPTVTSTTSSKTVSESTLNSNRNSNRNSRNTPITSDTPSTNTKNDTTAATAGVHSSSKALRKAQKQVAKDANTSETSTPVTRFHHTRVLTVTPSSDTGRVVFPTTLRLPLLIATLQLERIETAPVMDLTKLEARILRYVHHHHLSETQQLTSTAVPPATSTSTASSNNNNNNKDITVNVWTMLSAYIQEYLYLHLHHPHVMPPVPSHYHIDETAFPPQCFTNYEPRAWQDHSISSIRINASAPNALIQLPSQHQSNPHPNNNNTDISDNWLLQLSPFDANAVNKAQQRGLGYLDRKYAFFSQGLHSTLYLRLRVTHTTPMWLCELQKGFLKYPASMTDLDLGAEVLLHVNYFVRHATRKATAAGDTQQQQATTTTTNTVALAEGMGLSSSALRTNDKDSSKMNHHVDQHVVDDPAFTMPIDLAVFSDQCYRSRTSLPPGDHLLSIQQKGLQQINVAYVVTF